MTKKISNLNLAFRFGVVFIVVILVIALFIPCPTTNQAMTFRIVLAIAVAGVAAMIPGFFKFKYKQLVSAGGALAVFGFTYLFNPATLVTQDDCGKPFSVAMFVHGSDGRNDLVVKNEGEISIDFNNVRRTEKIDYQGRAVFTDIEATFKNDPVSILIAAKGYEPLNSDSTYILDGKPIYIELRRDQSLATISGDVRDEDGNFLRGVTLRIQNVKTITDSLGYFELKIPLEKQRKEQTLTAILNGYKIWEGFVYPETQAEVKIILEKK